MSAPTTPNTTDLAIPFDPTSYTEIDGAQLAQLVSGASPATGIGFVVITADSGTTPNVPNASVTTKWQNYIWLRVNTSNNALIAYVWNPNVGSGPLDNWVPISSATIGPGTIQGYMIANNTIPASAIISLNYSQLNGAPALATYNTTQVTNDGLINTAMFNGNTLVWGALTSGGTTPGTPVLSTNAVATANIQANAVTAAKMANGAITTTQLLSTGGVDYPVQLTGAVDPFINISIPAKSLIGIPSNSNYSPTSSGSTAIPGDILALNASASSSTVPGGYTTLRKAILTLAEPSSPATGQIPFIASGQSAYALINPQGANSNSPLGRILQEVIIVDSTPLSATYSSTAASYASSVTAGPSTSRPAYSAIPTYGTNASGVATTTVAAITNLVSTFSPLQGLTSTIIVEVEVQLGSTSGNAVNVAALFMNPASTASNAVAAASNSSNSVQYLQPVTLKYKVVPASTSPIVFQVCYGTTAGNAQYNNTGGSTTAAFGAVCVSSMKITEYL